MPKKMRGGKTERVPRTRAGGEWTEAQFWGFIRSGLRGMSRRWPPLVRLALLACRRPSQSSNKRLKWEHQCNDCGDWFPRKKVQVDHIEPCGSLRSFDDVGGFVERLFCETSELRVLCAVCHNSRTYSNRVTKEDIEDGIRTER
jgi:hypothetical protein